MGEVIPLFGHTHRIRKRKSEAKNQTQPEHLALVMLAVVLSVAAGSVLLMTLKR